MTQFFVNRLMEDNRNPAPVVEHEVPEQTEPEAPEENSEVKD